MAEQLSEAELLIAIAESAYEFSRSNKGGNQFAKEVIALVRRNTRVEVTEEQVETLAIIKFCGTANSEMWRKLPAERRDSYRVKSRIELRAAGIKVKERNA